MPKIEKEIMLKELGEFLKSGSTVFLAEYSGVSANEMNNFRKNLKKEGASCKVLKNNLLKNSVSEQPYRKIVDLISGPAMMVAVSENPVKIAKVVSGFAQEHNGVKLKAGFVEKSFVRGEEISEIAKLPPRDVLMARLLGGFMTPVSRFLSVISAPAGALVNVLNQISKQTGGDNDGREGN